MHLFADPVPRIRTDHAVTVCFRVRLHFITDVVERCARFQTLDPFIETFFGYLDKLFYLGRYFADLKRSTGVAVIAVFIRASVHADDIAVL